MILITGATGHIGNVLTRELIADGHLVRALVLPGEDRAALAGLPVEFFEGDILQPETLHPALEGVRTVYHLAGMISILPGKDDLVWRVNVQGTKNMVDASVNAGVRRFVYTSSIHAIRRAPQGILIDESQPFDPESPCNEYDRSKAEATLIVLQAIRQGLDAVIVCPTGVIGPHDYRGSEMGLLIKDWMKEPVSVLIDGCFDFVDVRDVAHGMILAGEQGKAGDTFILSGEPIALETLKNLVQGETGRKTPSLKLPVDFARNISQLMPFIYKAIRTRPRFTTYSIDTVVGNSTISHAKATRQLGYAPRSLKDTVIDTVRWWSNYLKRPRSMVKAG